MQGSFRPSNSVVNDVVRIFGAVAAAGNNGAPTQLPNALSTGAVMDADESSSLLRLDNNYVRDAFYVRINLTDGLGITKAIGAAAE